MCSIRDVSVGTDGVGEPWIKLPPPIKYVSVERERERYCDEGYKPTYVVGV